MKRFKDPIYGYIYIPQGIVKNVVDTSEFQRLRYIRQTSYLPVYPSALHNRFTHSLGVYFLGTIAFKAVKESYNKINAIPNIDKENMKKRYNVLIKWLKCFEEIHISQNIDFDFAIISATKFESSFNKDDLRKTLIYFPINNQSYPLNKLIDLFSSKKLSRHTFFYIYYIKGNNNIDVDVIGKRIAKLALE